MSSSALINQKIIRKIRSFMTSAQQEYLFRVFFKNEKSTEVMSEMKSEDDFEENLLRSLRAAVPILDGLANQGQLPISGEKLVFDPNLLLRFNS